MDLSSHDAEGCRRLADRLPELAWYLLNYARALEDGSAARHLHQLRACGERRRAR